MLPFANFFLWSPKGKKLSLIKLSFHLIAVTFISIKPLSEKSIREIYQKTLDRYGYSLIKENEAID